MWNTVNVFPQGVPCSRTWQKLFLLFKFSLQRCHSTYIIGLPCTACDKLMTRFFSCPPPHPLPLCFLGFFTITSALIFRQIYFRANSKWLGSCYNFSFSFWLMSWRNTSLPSFSCGRKHIELMHQIILYLRSLKDGWDWHNNEGFSKRE